MTPELWAQGSDRSADPRDELVQALLGLRWALPRTDADARTALDQLSAVAARLGRLGAEAAQAAEEAGGGEGEAQAPWQAQVQALLAQAGFALDWWRPVLDDIDLDWTLNHQAHLSADLARIASAGARILDQYAPPRHAFGTAAAAQGATAAVQSGADRQQPPSVEAAQAYEAAQSPQAPPKRSQAPRVAAAFGSVPAAAIVDPLASAGRHRRFAEDLGLPRPKQGSAKPSAAGSATLPGQPAAPRSAQPWPQESRALQAIQAAQEYQREREYRRAQERRAQAAQAVQAAPAPAPEAPAPDVSADAPETSVLWDFLGPTTEPEPERVAEPERPVAQLHSTTAVPEAELAPVEGLAQTPALTPIEPVDAAPEMPVPPLIPSVESLFGAPLPSMSAVAPAPVETAESEDELEDDEPEDAAPDDTLSDSAVSDNAVADDALLDDAVPDEDEERDEPVEETLAEFASPEPDLEPEPAPASEPVEDLRPEQEPAQSLAVDEAESAVAEPPEGVEPGSIDSSDIDSDGVEPDSAERDSAEPVRVDPDTAILDIAEPAGASQPDSAEPISAESISAEPVRDEPRLDESPLGMTSLYNPVLGGPALHNAAVNRPMADYSALDDPLFGKLPTEEDEAPQEEPDPLFGPALEPEPQPAADRENAEFDFDFLLPFGDYDDDADEKREADIRTEPPPQPRPGLNREVHERLVEPTFGPLPAPATDRPLRMRIPLESLTPPPVLPETPSRVGADDDGDGPDAPEGRSRAQRVGMAVQAVGVLGLVGVLAWWAVGHFDGHSTSNSGHPPVAAVTGTSTRGGAAPAASGGTHPAASSPAGAAPSSPAATTLPPNAADVTALQVSLEGGSSAEQDVTMIVSLDADGTGPVTVLVDYYGVRSGSSSRVDEMTATYNVDGPPYQFSVAIPSSDYCGTVFTLTASSGSVSSSSTTDPGC